MVTGPLAMFRLQPAKLARNAVITAALLLLALLSHAGRQYLIPRAEGIARPDRLATLTHRTEMWAEAWPTVRRSLPFGTGLGTSRFILLSEGEAQEAAEVGAAAPHLHSQHMLMLAETGVVGFVLLWLLFARFGLAGIECYSLPRGALSDLGFVLVCSCLVVAGDSFIHGWMLSAGSAYALLFWVIVTLLLKSERLARAQRIAAHGRGRAAAPPHAVPRPGGDTSAPPDGEPKAQE
jgi:O-antigen ligase